jgi:hypothetical protein
MNPLVPNTYYGESFSMLEAERKYAIESGTYWLEEVEIVKEKPISFADFNKPEVDRMYGMPDKSIKITDDDYSYFNVFDYLESNPVTGVLVSGDEISIRGGKTPLYMIDGIPNTAQDVAHVPMGDIDYIDIIKSGFGSAGLGSRGADGVIAIYTRVGTWSTFTRYVKGRATIKVHGFQWPSQFYSPKYTLENIEYEMPDYRPTLFWEPFVFLQENQAELEFFSSDFHSDYVVIVEGISMSGKICTGIGEFSVENYEVISKR